LKGEEKNTLLVVNPDTVNKLNLQVSLDSEAKALFKDINASLKSMKKEQYKTASVGIALAYFAGIIAAIALIVVTPSEIRGWVVAMLCILAVIVAIVLFFVLVVSRD